MQLVHGAMLRTKQQHSDRLAEALACSWVIYLKPVSLVMSLRNFCDESEQPDCVIF